MTIHEQITALLADSRPIFATLPTDKEWQLLQVAALVKIARQLERIADIAERESTGG